MDDNGTKVVVAIDSEHAVGSPFEVRRCPRLDDTARETSNERRQSSEAVRGMAAKISLDEHACLNGGIGSRDVISRERFLDQTPLLVRGHYRHEDIASGPHCETVVVELPS
jgi:hypothetical protein